MSRNTPTHANNPAVTRRFALGLGATGLAASLSACSGGSTSSSSHTTAGSKTSAAGGASSDSSAAGAAGAALPTKSEILARFGDRRPRAWALNLPGEITSIPAKGRTLALTFDACGGPGGSGYDEKLIELLRTHKVKATLNFNARWIRENASVARELAADPLFRIANHGTRHLPLSTTGRSAYGIKGTASLGELYDEVVSAHGWIAQHCPNQPILFRSGTAFSDDIGVDVCRALGMPFLGYTINGDGGTTFTPAQVVTALNGCRPGDVVISHMNHPERGTRAGYVAALPRLIDRGFTFTHVDIA